MPAIPTYDQTVAAPENFGRQHIPTASGADPIAAGLAGIGQGLGNLSSDLTRQMAVQKQAEQKQADERAKVWAGQQAGTSLLAETQALDEAQRKAAPGADGFAESYLTGFDDRAKDALANAPDDASKRYLQQHIQAQRTHLGAAAMSFQFREGDRDAVSRFSDSTDTWAKVVQQDPTQYAAAARVLGDTMPDVVPDVKNKLTDHARATLTDAAASHFLDADPYKVQDGTSKAMGFNGFTGKTGVPWIDDAKPAQIAVWNDRATTKIKQLEAAQARTADATNKIAEKTFNAAFDLSTQGQYFSPDFQTGLLAATKGTPWEQEAQGLISDQKNTAGFASGPADQRQATLNEMRSSGSDPTKGTNPMMAKQVAKFEKINSSIDAAITKDPWEAAQQYGVVTSAPLQNITNADDALKTIKARVAQAGPVESWTGKPVSPLRPQEASQLSDFVAKLPPAQAASLLGQIGDAVGDSARTAEIAKQLHDKDGTMGLAMALANTQTTEGRYASELVLSGNQLIRDGAVKVDGTKETGWKAEIASKVRGAYANQQVEDQVVKSAFLISAAKGGDTDNAIRLATGGGIIDFNGSKVPMPTGFSVDGQSSAEDKFHKAIETLDPAQLMPQITDGKVYAGGTPMAASDFYRSLPQAQLVMAGRNRTGGNSYAVKAGNTLVTNAAGRPILIQVK